MSSPNSAWTYICCMKAYKSKFWHWSSIDYSPDVAGSSQQKNLKENIKINESFDWI